MTNFAHSAASMSPVMSQSTPARERRAQRLGARAHGPVELADGEPGDGVAVADHAGPLDHRRDVGDAAHEALGRDEWGEPLARVDPVLERDHRGLRPDQRGDGARGGLGVVDLDREQHEVGGPERRRVVARRHRINRRVAERA
ncbi:MAG: hypothetical protein IIA01_02165 [Proteobacteria bacterium]|nr:hypothetical protein [Pseudomonadota bacterium]